MNHEKMLRINRRQTLGATFQAMRVAAIYRKGQKHLSKNCCISKEYPGQTTYLQQEHNLKISELLLQAIPWASQSPIYMYSMYNLMKRHWKNWQKPEGTSFLSFFWQKIHEKKLFWVETCSKNHCSTHCIINFSIQAICIILRRTEPGKLWLSQKFD